MIAFPARVTFVVALICAPICAMWLRSAHAESPLALDEAVQIALAGSPQLAAPTAALEAATAASISAGRLPDPELIVGVDNLPIDGPERYSLDDDFMTMRKVGVMQTFPNGRKRASQRERATAAVLVAQSQEQQTRLEISRATADAWIACHIAQLVLGKLHSLEPEVELQAQAARTALASGRGSTVDALAAQSAIGELDDRLLEAQREVHVTRTQLAQWIGEDAQRVFAAAPVFSVLPVEREELLASLHRHASLLTFEAQRALARSEIDLARAEKRSDWSAQLAYAKRGPAFSDMVSLEFRVGLPLFSRYRQDPMIRAKRAELAQLEAGRDAELRMHTAEVSNMLAAWETANQRIDLYEHERLPLARQRSQAALAGFQAGRIELSQVVASQVAEIELQLGYAELLKQSGQAWTFLRYLENGREAP